MERIEQRYSPSSSHKQRLASDPGSVRHAAVPGPFRVPPEQEHLAEKAASWSPRGSWTHAVCGSEKRGAQTTHGKQRACHGGGQFGDRVHVDALPVPWTQLCRECKERGHSAVDTRSICFESPVEIGNDTRIVRGGFGSTPFPQTVNSPKVPPNVKSTDHPCRDPQLHGENGILTPLGNGAISHTRTQTPLAAVPQKR